MVRRWTVLARSRYTLETQQLPMLEKLYKLPTDTEGTFIRSLFVNLATQMGVKWGTDSKVRLFDPASPCMWNWAQTADSNIRVSHARKLLLRVVSTTSA